MPPQFSLAQLLLLMGAVCVVLAIYRALGWEVGTVAVGILAVVGMLVIGIARGNQMLAGTAGVLLLLGGGWAVLMPAMHTTHVYTRRGQCTNNLRQIAIAFHTYHDTYGSFPPAYVADKDGRPMHSWRVLILPFMEQHQLYNLYRFDEPWDGPNNRKLHQYGLPYNKCPSDDANPPNGSQTETSYLVVVGPRTAFPGDKCVALSDITDGAGNTLLVAEVHSSGIHWMEPRDLHVTQMARQINPSKGQGISSKHHRGANVVMADGSVQFFSAEKLTAEDVQSLLTIDGNEPPPSASQE